MAKEPLPQELYRILACPTDKAAVTYTKDRKALQCSSCKARYPIKDGIPVMLPKSSA